MIKFLKVLNTIAIGVPVMFALVEWNIYGLAFVSTMLTGFLQVVIGLIFWKLHPQNRYIMAYHLLTALFFILLYRNAGNWCWYLPPALCLYLSIIIYTQKTQP